MMFKSVLVSSSSGGLGGVLGKGQMESDGAGGEDHGLVVRGVGASLQLGPVEADPDDEGLDRGADDGVGGGGDGVVVQEVAAELEGGGVGHGHVLAVGDGDEVAGAAGVDGRRGNGGSLGREAEAVLVDGGRGAGGLHGVAHAVVGGVAPGQKGRGVKKLENVSEV